MTEDEAREQVTGIVGSEAAARLKLLADLIVAENERQNLISRSTIPVIWSRHLLDSVQLLQWSSAGSGTWIDIGTGGGFPGLAIALADERKMVLVEPRRQRADFLSLAVQHFDLAHVQVCQSRASQLDTVNATTISARAVAPIEVLLDQAEHCSSWSTQWLLPRGAGWRSDLDAAKVGWKGMFHVEQSLTDPLAGIVVASQVSRR